MDYQMEIAGETQLNWTPASGAGHFPIPWDLPRATPQGIPTGWLRGIRGIFHQFPTHQWDLMKNTIGKP